MSHAGVTRDERTALQAPEPHRRRTPIHARGEPQVWLTGASLVISLGAIMTLLAIVAFGGLRAFWPQPVERVTLSGGEMFLAVPVRDDLYAPEPARLAELQARIASGRAPASALTPEGLALRRLYRVGNREVRGQPFRWVEEADIASRERPRDAVMLERAQWGVWIGVPTALALEEPETAPAEGGAASGASGAPGEARTEFGSGRVERRDAGGGRWVRRVYLAEGPEATLAKFRELHGGAVALRSRIERLKEVEIGRVNARAERARLALRKAELQHAEGRRTDAELDAARAAREEAAASLEREHGRITAEIAALEARDARLRLIVEDPGLRRFAPESQSAAGTPMRLSQVVRLVEANGLDWLGRLGVYADRWREFLTDEPREANTEGGVMPVIFGTVVMTVLLSLAVAPMGVIAALYLREYAKQGVIVSAVRVAVNNLAGVPSIVYGVFGLGFFCYTMGRFIDGGPAAAWPKPAWIIGVVALVPMLAAAATARVLSKPTPGKPVTTRHHVMYWIGLVASIGTVVLVITLLATNPYFKGFFRERLPTATFGTKGILWASLTLALLTLPVVIVATEEAVSAVPRALREGSIGCGASKWQTIRRIVLPRAAPGIMTGLILAMARGAGEVAPLMLVGAVKLAPELPVEGQFPFVHLERSFMHLGFHIYDLGFQSPDSEAARPTVWATTLLLIVIVALLNLTAISLRARLRRRFHQGAF